MLIVHLILKYCEVGEKLHKKIIEKSQFLYCLFF